MSNRYGSTTYPLRGERPPAMKAKSNFGSKGANYINKAYVRHPSNPRRTAVDLGPAKGPECDICRKRGYLCTCKKRLSIASFPWWESQEPAFPTALSIGCTFERKPRKRGRLIKKNNTTKSSTPDVI